MSNVENIKLDAGKAMAFLERQLIQGADPLYVAPSAPAWAILDLKARRVVKYDSRQFSATVYDSYEELTEDLNAMQEQLKRPDLADALCDLEFKLNEMQIWNKSTLWT